MRLLILVVVGLAVLGLVITAIVNNVGENKRLGGSRARRERDALLDALNKIEEVAGPYKYMGDQHAVLLSESVLAEVQKAHTKIRKELQS